MAKRRTRSYSCFGVDPDGGEVGGNLVAQHALDHVQVVIDQRRAFAVVGAGLDLGPQTFQEANIGAQLFFGCALRGGADDESAVAVFALADDDALQPLALFFGSNLARHAGVIDRRHVDQEAAGQGDVAGDAGALFADGFFGDLNQNFLTFFEQVGDQRNILLFVAAEASSASTAASALTDAVVESRTRRALGVGRGTGRSADFDAGIDGAVASGFGIEKSFGFRLGFLELRFFCLFFFLLGNRFVDLFAGERLVDAAFDDKRFRSAGLAGGLCRFAEAAISRAAGSR